MNSTGIPHLRVVVATSLLAVAGYFAFSIWAVFYSADAALRGDVIGTWKSFAVLAFGFWLGSSSGGKAAAANESDLNQKREDNTAALTGLASRALDAQPGRSDSDAVEGADRAAGAAADEADQVRRET